MKLFKQVRFLMYLLNVEINVNVLAQLKNTALPEIIYELCPYSDICNRTASRIFNIEGMIPCCSSCACDEDCGLRLDCCFDYLDKYKLVEKGKVACIDTTIMVESDEQTDHIKNGYLMVKTCDNENFETKEGNGVISQCRLTDKNKNSLIAPVSSRETNLIYVNKECAACNKVNISRMKEWNYLFKSNFVTIDSIITDVQSNLRSQLGTFVYVPPMDENWSNKRCYNEYVEIEKCSISNVWQHMCNHLRATYLNYFGKVHKNVFCQLCKGIQIDTLDKVCKSQSIKGTGTVPTLTMLFDNAVIEASKLSKIGVVTDSLKPHCPFGKADSITETCMPIRCPEGLLQTKNSCSYFALRWYTPWLLMQVKLQPKTGYKLPVSKLPHHGAPERTKPFLWLKVPCRKAGLASLQVYYSTAEETIQQNAGNNVTLTYVTSFVIRIWKVVQTDKGVDPSVTIPLYHECVTETWLAKCGNETYTFNAYFDKYSGYIQDGIQILEKWPFEGSNDWEDSARPASYTLLAEGPASISSFVKQRGIVLKKPYFCNQVHVPIHDVDIRFGEILILSKNISLGTNEYIVNKPILNGDVNVRAWNLTTFSVCIDDYDPSYTNVSGSKVFKKSLIELIACVLLVYYLLQ